MTGYVVVILSTVLYSTTQVYGVLFIARAVQGIGSACIATSGFALLALVNPDDEARGYGIKYFCEYIMDTNSSRIRFCLLLFLFFGFLFVSYLLPSYNTS